MIKKQNEAANLSGQALIQNNSSGEINATGQEDEEENGLVAQKKL